jgi:hexokinase
MISGMYMGEIVRLIILDLLQQELLFLGHRDTYGDYKAPLYDRGGFYTKFVSTVETDEGKSQMKFSSIFIIRFRFSRY